MVTDTIWAVVNAVNCDVVNDSASSVAMAAICAVVKDLIWAVFKLLT